MPACPMLCDRSQIQGCVATGMHGWPRRQHELELRKDKADVKLLMMQQGLSTTLGAAPPPSKADLEAQSGKASNEMVTVLEQRLQLLTEEAAQLRETIVKQAGLHICIAHALLLLETIPDMARRAGYCSVRVCRLLLRQ